MGHPSKTIVSVLAIICIIVNSGFLGELLSIHPVSASGSLSSWNPRVSCVPMVVKITDITANSTGTTSYNTSPYSPGLTSPMGLAKRWLTSGATPPGWVSPGPPCTIKDSQGVVISIFVEIDHVRITSTYLTETDCSSTFDTVNGAGGYTTGGTKCDVTANLYSSPTNVCTSATDPGCWYKIHTEFDKDWQGAGYCGSSTVCDPSQAQSQIVAQSTYIDVQGFVYWDPDHLSTQWHSFSGWELHPLTAWRLSNGVQGLASAFTFSPANPGVNQPVTFTASVSGGSPPYSLQWNFGDGSVGTGSPISHSYSASGSYTVTLTVADAAGSTSTTSKIALVSGPPDYTISLSPTSLIVPVGGSGSSTVTLKSINGFTGTLSLAATISPSGPTASFSSTSLVLNSGGTSTSTLTFQAPTTLAPGNYTVTVTATNGTLAHSAILLVNAKAVPDFSILTNPPSFTMLQGGSAGSIVTMTSLNGFSGPVSLSATVSAGGFGVQLNPNKPNVSPGSSSTSILTITSPNNALPQTYLVTLKGQSGSITHTVTLPLTVTSFALDINSGSITFPPGSKGTFNVILSSINGFSGNITLSEQVSQNKITAALGSALVGLPSGRTISTIMTVNSTAPGSYSVRVTASIGKLIKSLQVAVYVATQPDFFLSADPIFLVVPQGSSENSTITVTSVNGLSGSVNLHLAVNPAGPVGSLNPLSVQLVSAGSVSSTLTVSVSSSVQVGIYSITVTGSDGPNHSVILTLFVTRQGPDFTFSATPNSQTVAAGSSASYNISLTSLDGFSGNITLTTSSQSGLNSSLNPSVVILTAGSPASSTLTVTTTSATVLATYQVSITATSGSLTHAISVNIIVTAPPDFTLTSRPASQTMFAGNVAATSISLNNVNGFAGIVSLASTISPTTGLKCTLTPTEISGSQTSTLSCSGSARNYSVTVTGTSGSLSRSTNVTFTVQDFTISASPQTINLSAGSSGNPTITITSLQGFNGVVGLTSTPSSAAISASLNPTSVAGSGNSTLTVSGSIPGAYTVNVTGTSSSLSHSVIVYVNVNPIRDFAMSASPTSVTADAQTPSVSNITVTSVHGFTGTVDLSQNGGATCSLSASSIALTATSTSGSVALGCTFASAGKSNVTVTGSSGSNTRSTTVTFTVQDFRISANPTTVSATAQAAGTSNITVTALQGFTGVVNLATNSTSCTVAPNGVTGSGSATLSCTLSSTGIVHVIVAGTSGSLSHSVIVTYNVGGTKDFTVTANPTSVTVLAGVRGNSTITVTSLNGFTGTITLSSSVSPTTGLSCSLNPSSLILGSSTTSALSCRGSHGAYTVTVSGTNGTLSRTATVNYTIPDFTIAVSPTTMSLMVNSQGNSTITISSLNGFAGVVTLSATSSDPSLTATLNPTAVSGSGSSSLRVSGTSQGNFNVTVTGTSGSLVHTTTLFVAVQAQPDFNISAGSAQLTVSAGGTNSTQVLLRSFNGFSGNVILTASSSPSGPALSFSQSSLMLASGGSASSTLTISSTTSTSSGTYIITVTGKSGPLAHNATISLSVTGQSSPGSYSVGITITGLPFSLNTGLYVNGTLTQTMAGGSTVNLSFPSGSSNLIGVDSFVTQNNQTRYASSKGSVLVTGTTSITFSYLPQYLLVVSGSPLLLQPSLHWQVATGTIRRQLHSCLQSPHPPTTSSTAGPSTEQPLGLALLSRSS